MTIGGDAVRLAVRLGWISYSARSLCSGKYSEMSCRLQFADVLNVSSQERACVLSVVIHAKRVAVDALQPCQMAGQHLAMAKALHF